MDDAIVLELLGTEREGAGREVIEVEMLAETADDQSLQADSRPED
jgi:hypothetical protein